MLRITGHMEHILGHSRREPTPIINGYMIGEAVERDRQSIFKEKLNTAVQACTHMWTPHISNWIIQHSGSCDTAARCPRGCSSNFTPPPQSKSNSSSLHHRLVLRDLNYHPRQILQSTVTCAGQDRPAVRDHRLLLRTSPTDEQTGEAPQICPTKMIQPTSCAVQCGVGNIYQPTPYWPREMILTVAALWWPGTKPSLICPRKFARLPVFL